MNMSKLFSATVYMCTFMLVLNILNSYSYKTFNPVVSVLKSRIWVVSASLAHRLQHCFKDTVMSILCHKGMLSIC